MRMRRIVLAAALACGAPAATAAAQAPAADEPPSQGPRRVISGEMRASDYHGITDRRVSNGLFEAELAVNEEGVPTGCRAARSTGNQAVDERTCALLIERVRYTRRIDATGKVIADTVVQELDVGRLVSGPPPAQPIQLGETVRGRLESGDQVASNGTFYDAYTLTAPSAMSLRITMRSAELGPRLWVVYGDPRQVKGKGTNDTTGRTEVEVVVDVPAGSSVRIEANAYARGMQGAYTLRVTANQPGGRPGN